MTDTDADKFRKKAEECSQQAESSVSQLEKEYWLRLAADWIKLAENAEERRSQILAALKPLGEAARGHGIFGTIFRGAH